VSLKTGRAPWPSGSPRRRCAARGRPRGPQPTADPISANWVVRFFRNKSLLKIENRTIVNFVAALLSTAGARRALNASGSRPGKLHATHRDINSAGEQPRKNSPDLAPDRRNPLKQL